MHYMAPYMANLPWSRSRDWSQRFLVKSTFVTIMVYLLPASSMPESGSMLSHKFCSLVWGTQQPCPLACRTQLPCALPLPMYRTFSWVLRPPVSTLASANVKMRSLITQTTAPVRSCVLLSGQCAAFDSRIRHSNQQAVRPERCCKLPRRYATIRMCSSLPHALPSDVRCVIDHNYIHVQIQEFSKLLSTRSYISRADPGGHRLATHQGLAALRGRFGLCRISSIHSTADPSVGLQGTEHPSDTSLIFSKLPNVSNLEHQLGKLHI